MKWDCRDLHPVFTRGILALDITAFCIYHVEKAAVLKQVDFYPAPSPPPSSSLSPLSSPLPSASVRYGHYSLGAFSTLHLGHAEKPHARAVITITIVIVDITTIDSRGQSGAIKQQEIFYH